MTRALALALVTLSCGASTQTPQCKAYVACTEATGTSNALIRNTYGEAGSCWTADPSMTGRCTSDCQTALDQLKSVYPDAGC